MRIPRAPQFALLIAAALVTTACGGDDGGSSGGDGGGGNASSEPLRVITSEKYDLPMIGADAGNHLGIFEEMGLDVEVLAGQEAAQGLASGDVEIAIASPNRFIGGILQGLEATLVGPTIDVWGQYVIVRADLDVDSVEDLEGGRWGISGFGSAGHYSAEKIADELGWGEGDYEIVTLGDLEGLMAGIRNGTIDGFAWSAQAAFTLEHEGAAKVVGNVGDVIGPNPLDVIAVSNKAIEERPDDVRAFCEGFYEAQRQFKEDPELAEKTYLEEWGFEAEVTPRILEAGLPLLSTDSAMDDAMFDNMAEATTFTIDGAEVTGDDVREMYTDCSEL
jgi:ABC-type nitrate/sulfonate/bicarbonate transport system substrate-binding protein